jgi:hypothetical protein
MRKLSVFFLVVQSLTALCACAPLPRIGYIRTLAPPVSGDSFADDNQQVSVLATVLEESSVPGTSSFLVKVEIENLSDSKVLFYQEPEGYRKGYLKFRVFTEGGDKVRVNDNLGQFLSDDADLVSVMPGESIPTVVEFDAAWVPESHRCAPLLLEARLFIQIPQPAGEAPAEEAFKHTAVTTNSIAFCIQSTDWMAMLGFERDCCR